MPCLKERSRFDFNTSADSRRVRQVEMIGSPLNLNGMIQRRTVTMAEKLAAELDLIQEASELAQSQLVNRSIYHGLDWEIGLSIASTAGEQTATPFVTLVFKGTNAQGDIVSHPLSLSYGQFLLLSQSATKMQKSLAAFH
jgi:hypothetical protein